MRIFFAVVWVMFSVEVTAQELWLRPEKYFWEPNQVAQIDLVRGQDFIAQPAPAGTKLDRLELEFQNVHTDIRRKFADGEKPALTVNLGSDGIYTVLAVARGQSLTWARSDFLSYARDFELANILADSVSVKGDSVDIQLTRYLKAYVRVGKAFDRRPELPSDLPLEIIPDKNPLLLRRGERITLTILKNGKPAFGVRVKIWNRWNNRTTLQHIYTEQNGTVNTTISSPGDWMVSVAAASSRDNGSTELEVFCLNFGFR